jgi:hypothetical protein
MAITYQQAVEFRDGPIGSQIAYVERVLRPSNWNNLNKGLKAKYLGEVERAMKDPYGFALEKLQADVSGLVIYSNTRGGLAAAEAAEREKNVEKSINFLQQGNQPVGKIQEAVNQGIQTGAASVEEQNARRNEYPVIDRVADIALSIGLGAATAGLSTGAQIAINAAIALEQGAKPEDIARGAIGSILANQFTPLAQGQTTGVSVIDDFNKVIQKIKNPELQSAIFNGVRQGVYATATEQNIAKNVVAGAVAGALATNIQNKYNDPALANAAGEYFQAKIAGKSDIEAAAAAFSGYATEEQKANAKKAVLEETFNLPLEQRKALGYMTRDEVAGLTSGEVGSFSQVPSEIATKEGFRTMSGEAGEDIIQVTEKDGTVTYQKRITAETPLGNKIGYIIVYDPKLNEFQYEYRTRTAEGTETISSKTKPSLRTLDASQTILPPSLGTQTGQRTQGEVSVQEMPTISLLRRVRVGQETRQNETPLQGDVYGVAGFDREGELAPQESVAQREPEENERTKQRLITESTQDTPQEEPETQRQTNNTVLLGLLGGSMTSAIPRTQRTPNEREAANMQALSQALSVGDPGDALFGSGLGRRRNVWNVESLRLKDELGG